MPERSVTQREQRPLAAVGGTANPAELRVTSPFLHKIWIETSHCSLSFFLMLVSLCKVNRTTKTQRAVAEYLARRRVLA